MTTLNTSTPAKTKLQVLRNLAVKYGGSWRDYRTDYRYSYRPKYLVWNPSFSAYGEKHCRWVENVTRAGLRFVGYADDIVDLRHAGWYADPYCDETLRGAVWQLPGRNNSARYVYWHDDYFNDGAASICMNICVDKKDAAFYADGFAERAAEDLKEHYVKDWADIRITEIQDELQNTRKSIIALCKEAREYCETLSSALDIRAAVRAKIASLLCDRTNLRNEREKLTNNPWSVWDC